MNKLPFEWPEEVPVEQKLYYLIRLLNRKRTGAIYESAQTFSGLVLRSAEIYRQECLDLDQQARGVIPYRLRDAYELPDDYEARTKNAPLPELPPNWDDLYLCGGRCIAIPRPRDPLLDAMKPSYGEDPLQSYLEAEVHSFSHWVAAANHAKELGLLIPPKPKGRVPEELQDEIKRLRDSLEDTPRESKFEVWKRDWESGQTTQPWRGRIPAGAEYPTGYKTGRMQLEELENSIRSTGLDPVEELAKAKAALWKKSVDTETP